MIRARNVILFIGDGMGPAQREAGRRWPATATGATATSALGLVMDTLPVAGLVGTACLDPDGNVTDSAASATALATGVKTVNGAIATDPDGRRLATILELAQAAGKSTGLVTTCQVTDATPAAFGAHVPDRGTQHEIARQFIAETGVDVILGGGASWWLPGPEDADAVDDAVAAPAVEPILPRQADLTELARAMGYHYLDDARDLAECTWPKVLGLFDRQELFRQNPEGQDATYDPVVRLRELTRAAITTLARNPDGFFLMVEEAAIDRMGHHNNGPMAIKGVHELDLAVAEGLAFARRYPDTLIIVTADHECGGLSVDGSDDLAADGWSLTWSTTGHTAEGVPLTAIGPWSEALAGAYENTHVFDVMRSAMGLEGVMPLTAPVAIASE